MGRNAKAIAAISALLLLTCALGATSAFAAPPVVSMGSVSSIGHTSAHLSGTIDPQDNETFYSFEYATDPKAANWSGFAFEGAVPAGSGPTTVEADLSGLKPGTEYFVRLAGWNFLDPQIPSKPLLAFETTPVSAPAVSISSPSQITDQSAHFEGEINPGAIDPAFDVNWRFECTPACPGLEGTTPADGSSHTVEADATGLKPGTAYSVSLIAQNAGAEASAGPEGFTTDTRAPAVLSTSVAPLNTEATLRGQVDPGGLATTYRFEYGPTMSYGQSTATKTIPAGGDPVSVKGDVAGLTPGSGYHFRLVVSNAGGSDESADRGFSTYANEAPQGNCPNEAVRIQQGATYLPDCRAYEQVSPVDKNGTDAQDDTAQNATLRLSTDGRAIAWRSKGAYANVPGIDAEADYVGRRTDSGWKVTGFAPSRVINPQIEAGASNAATVRTFSGDLSRRTFITAGGYVPQDEDGIFALDVYQLDETGRVTWISHGEGIVANNPARSATAKGVSEDGGTVFFLADEPMTPEVPDDGISRIYRWRHGVVEAVGTDPSGALLPGASFLGNGTSGGLLEIGEQGGRLADSDAISSDGSVFVFGSNGAVFLHQDGVPNIEISLSKKTGSVGQPASRAEMVAATPELRKIYIYSPDQLTDDAPAGGGTYIYSRATGSLAFSNPEDPQAQTNEDGMNFSQESLVRVSDDGSYVYFTSTKDLDAGAVGGESNLYLRHDGETRFIATLARRDSLGVLRLFGRNSYPSRTASGISADGTRLVFLSQASLAGSESGGKREAYLYDAQARSLRCVSCSSTGAAPGADVRLGYATGARAISADGKVVVFTSGDALVPRDVNGVADVYEYRAGRISLLSSGLSPSASVFVDMSPDATDVYILARESLAASDIDNGARDVYDVRAGGGFLTEDQTPACQGDACQGPSSALPATAGIASAAFSHAGDTKVRHHQGKKRHRPAHRKKRHRGPAKRAGGSRGGSK